MKIPYSVRNQHIYVPGKTRHGKSTLFHQLGMIDIPTAGVLSVLGADVLKLSEKKKTGFRLKNIGYIFQDYALIPTLTAVENVALPLLMAGMGKTKAYAQANATLESVGLTGRDRHLPSALSGGQQQRVSIARAVSHAPAIILADEPTANLDHESSLAIMGIFRDLARQGIAVIMITHEEEYAKLTDRVITLFDGNIMSDERI